VVVVAPAPAALLFLLLQHVLEV